MEESDRVPMLLHDISLCQHPYMRQIKNAFRPQMTEESLKNQLKLKTSMLKTNIPMLAQQK